jgi:cytochrome c5
MRGLRRRDTEMPEPPHPTLSPTELGFIRVRSLFRLAEVGYIRLRPGRGGETLCPPHTATRVAFFIIMCTVVVGSAAYAADPTAEQIEEGVSIYEDFCAMCHGRDMINTGGFAFDLRKFPKNDFERFRNSVLNGKGGMPPWRDKLTDEDIDLLWAYIGTSSAN